MSNKFDKEGEKFAEIVLEGQIDKIKRFLLKKKNSVSIVNFPDPNGQTALHKIIKETKAKNRKEIIDFLISEKVSCALKDKDGWTPLHCACYYTSPNTQENYNIIEILLLQREVQVNVTNDDGNTPLHYFFRNYNDPSCETLLKLFKEKGVDVNATNKNLETPLFNTVWKKYMFSARWLIANGVIVDKQNKNKESCLHWACREGNLEMATVLMEAGADPLLDSGSGTPIDYARKEHQDEIVKKAEEVVIKRKKEQGLVEWLKGLGLEKYAGNLLKEEFDLDSLHLMNEDDLKGLEIPTGPRLRILNAMKEVKEKKGEKKKDTSVIDTFTVPSTAAVIDYNDLTMGNLLGKGYFAEVRQATWNGTEVAVKVLYRETFSNKNEAELFYKEVEILSKLRFPYIVQFIGVCTGEHYCIVTEYMADGSLHSILHNSPEEILHNPELQITIAIDIARGMNYLHTHKPPIVHRDLTSKNILLDSGHAKVADFGLSREQGIGEMTSSVGALPWVAPEVFTGEAYSMAADIYSYGVILWELFTGKDPHGDAPPLVHAQRVAFNKWRPPIPENVPQYFKDLIERCWAHDPLVRPRFDEILNILSNNTTPSAEVVGYLDSEALAQARAQFTHSTPTHTPESTSTSHNVIVQTSENKSDDDSEEEDSLSEESDSEEEDSPPRKPPISTPNISTPNNLPSVNMADLSEESDSDDEPVVYPSIQTSAPQTSTTSTPPTVAQPSSTISSSLSDSFKSPDVSLPISQAIPTSYSSAGVLGTPTSNPSTTASSATSSNSPSATVSPSTSGNTHPETGDQVPPTDPYHLSTPASSTAKASSSPSLPRPPSPVERGPNPLHLSLNLTNKNSISASTTPPPNPKVNHKAHTISMPSPGSTNSQTQSAEDTEQVEFREMLNMSPRTAMTIYGGSAGITASLSISLSGGHGHGHGSGHGHPQTVTKKSRSDLKNSSRSRSHSLKTIKN